MFTFLREVAATYAHVAAKWTPPRYLMYHLSQLEGKAGAPPREQSGGGGRPDRVGRNLLWNTGLVFGSVLSEP